jgi:conjugal transfer pilus assembly protein TraB
MMKSLIDKVRLNQYVLLWCLIGILLVVVLILVCLLLSDLPKSHESTSYKSSITTGASRIDPKEIWVEKFSHDQDLNTKRMDAMEKMFQTLIDMNQKTPEKQDSVSDLQNNLKQTMKEDFVQPASFKTLDMNTQPLKVIKNQSQDSFYEKKVFRSKGIQKITLSLHNARVSKALKTSDNTIPAGAFARTVLMGGVDASTSIQASNDPRPVLLRLTDHGTLPRKFKSDLKDCHALAACYGDISSERVFMRLEKLTCMERKTGEVLEITIQGYVAGEDGRAGLRGRVVDRAGESMRNAAVGGFLSGMGNFLGQAHNPISFFPGTGTVQTNPLTNGEILKSGVAKGATGALEKYADFYIKRAEQMQPVIQVEAGRIADIVFTQGVPLGDSVVRNSLVKENDQQRLKNIQNVKPFEAWTPQEGDH